MSEFKTLKAHAAKILKLGFSLVISDTLWDFKVSSAADQTIRPANLKCKKKKKNSVLSWS